MAHAGGRPPGAPNRRTKALVEKLEEINCHPDLILARVAMNDLECSVCRGKLRTKYKLQEGRHAHGCPMVKMLKPSTNNSPGAVFDVVRDEWVLPVDCECEGIGDRICQSCYGTGKEAVSVKDRKDAAAELMCYIACKRKAIEHTGADGEELIPRITVRFHD